MRAKINFKDLMNIMVSMDFRDFTMINTAGRGVRNCVDTPAMMCGRCPSRALTKNILEVVSRLPFMPPAQESATKIGIKNAAGL